MEETRSADLARLGLLLELQHRPRLGQRRQGAKQRNQRRLLREPLVQPAHESVKERAIGNGFPEVTEFIANRLDLLTEDANRTIALGDGAELDVEGRDAGIAVVLKETLLRLELALVFLEEERVMQQSVA